MKLIMTKGLPGSGKSTWAYEFLEQNPNTVLVCKDDLRAMMFSSAWTGSREKFILKARDFIVTEALKEGKNVVVHDTGFAPKHTARLEQLAKECEAEYEVKDFTTVPLEQCIQQDLRRLDSVGEKVIREMYRDWIAPPPPVVEYNKDLPKAIICDLDGTYCLFGDANPYERDFLQDKENPVVRTILLSCGKPDVQIIFVSGRKDKFLDQTRQWLNDHFGPRYELHMRKTLLDGEKEPKDVVIKQEIYENYVKGMYNILFVLDDRDQVVEFWRSQGLTCLQVAPGNF